VFGVEGAEIKRKKLDGFYDVEMSQVRVSSLGSISYDLKSM
jgi:hypothetical protein